MNTTEIMTLQGIKKCFQGYMLFITDSCDQRAWHYFDSWDELFYFCAQHYNKAILLMLSAQAKMTTERLLKALQVTGEDCVLIEFGSLTVKTWKALQNKSTWSQEEDFLFWQSICKEISLQKRLEILNLTTSNAAQLFGLSEEDMIQKISEGRDCQPHQILQLARVKAIFNTQLSRWLQCCAKINPAIVGIPWYGCPDDLYICDRDTLHALPFPFLYDSFVKCLMVELERAGMKAEKVMIGPEDYCAWLDQNSFESCYGARIAYATEKVNR